jgi:hypothetical protein
MRNLSVSLFFFKIYFLKPEIQLLYGTRKPPTRFEWNLLAARSANADRPQQYLSTYIKNVRVHGTGRNALLLTHTGIYSG